MTYRDLFSVRFIRLSVLSQPIRMEFYTSSRAVKIFRVLSSTTLTWKKGNGWKYSYRPWVVPFLLTPSSRVKSKKSASGKNSCGTYICFPWIEYYSWIPITRTFKGNRKRLEISGVRVTEGKISEKMTWREIEKRFELAGVQVIEGSSYPTSFPGYYCISWQLNSFSYFLSTVAFLFKMSINQSINQSINRFWKTQGLQILHVITTSEAN